MSWNYRAAKKRLTVDILKDEVTGEVVDSYSENQFGICEVYYNDEGKVTSTTERFIEPYGETLEELKANFNMMKEAFDKPVIDLDNIVYAQY